MLGKLALFVVIMAILLGSYLLLAPKETGYSPDSTPVTQATLDPSDWNSYTSPKFNYSFNYPKTWEFTPYDETNLQVQFGSHSLTNYKTVGIEEYMDHGIIDWRGFLGDKPAIKIDIQVYKTGTLEKMEAESETISPPTTQIGNLVTTEKKLKNEMTDQDIHTFEAEYNGNTIALNVYFYNTDNLSSVLKTSEGRELIEVFKSFRF